jgi:hypothetical protein
MFTKATLLTTGILMINYMSQAEPAHFTLSKEDNTTLYPSISTDAHGGGCCCASCTVSPIEIGGGK